MKANEFVKEHGFQYTRNLVRGYPNHTHVTDDGRMFISEKDYVEFAPHFKSSLSDAVKISDLKRLVASHELVESKGGLDATKHIVKSQHNLYTDMRLVQAIADVESCMEVS